MPNRRRNRLPNRADRLSELPVGDEERDAPELTARPRERGTPEDAEDDRLVPMENVGGAVPTSRGGDSGGDQPGPDDDLSSLAEPEPPEEAPEVGAMSVHRGDPSR